MRIQGLLFQMNLLEKNLQKTKITSDTDIRTGDKH